MGRGLPAVRPRSPRPAWLVPAGCCRSGAVGDGDGDLVAGLVGGGGDRSGGSGVDTGAAGHRAVRYPAGGGLVQRGWWQPPPTRLPCRPRPPGTWSPTCPAPAARASQTALTRPPGWPRSCGSTGCGIGSSRVTSRSKTSWAGPTSRSAPIRPSAAIKCWSTARSASAGTPGSSAIPRHAARRHLRSQHPAAERGGPPPALPPPSWPRALRAIRAWLTPWIALQRWWQAWSKAPPPPQLQALMNSVAAGRGLHLYIPN
jgi:hypothetical protein